MFFDSKADFFWSKQFDIIFKMSIYRPSFSFVGPFADRRIIAKFKSIFNEIRLNIEDIWLSFYLLD